MILYENKIPQRPAFYFILFHTLLCSRRREENPNSKVEHGSNEPPSNLLSHPDGERDQGRGVPFIWSIQTEASDSRLTSAATSRRRSAFTLVELLLVLVILGILAAIVILDSPAGSEQAKETAA